jgi:hypothetical protein
LIIAEDPTFQKLKKDILELLPQIDKWVSLFDDTIDSMVRLAAVWVATAYADAKYGGTEGEPGAWALPLEPTVPPVPEEVKRTAEEYRRKKAYESYWRARQKKKK